MSKHVVILILAAGASACLLDGDGDGDGDGDCSDSPVSDCTTLSDDGYRSSSSSYAEECDPATCDGVCAGYRGCIECEQSTDCRPNQECASDDTCRDRCRDDSDCASNNCYAGSCGDPMGLPCDPDDYPSCRGLSCTDVDANLLTVAPYCSGSCISDECPEGFVCIDYDCYQT